MAVSLAAVFLGVDVSFAKGNQQSIKRPKLEPVPRIPYKDVYIGFSLGNKYPVDEELGDFFESSVNDIYGFKVGYLTLDKESGFLGGVGAEFFRQKAQTRRGGNGLIRYRKFSTLTLHGDLGYREENSITGILFSLSKVYGFSPQSENTIKYDQISIGPIVKMNTVGEFIFKVSTTTRCDSNQYFTCDSFDSIFFDFLFYLE